MEEVEKANFTNSYFSDDNVVSRYLDSKKVRKKVLEYRALVNKSNVICSSACKSTDSLGSQELNLNKYVRSEKELRMRNLV